MIKAITFDLDGVYFVNGKANFISNLNKLFNIPEENAKQVFLKSDQMNSQYKCGLISDNQFWSWATKEWQIKATPQELIDLLIKGCEVNPEVIEVINKVRHNNYKTLICSNNFPARINGLDKRFNFLKNFDAIALSYKVGTPKPDPRIFKELINQSGVKAEEIVFADDNPDNLEGARNLGIKVFLYENFAQFLSKLQSLGIKLD